MNQIVECRKIVFLREVNCGERIVNPKPGERRHSIPVRYLPQDSITDRERRTSLLVDVQDRETKVYPRLLSVHVPASTHPEADPYAVVLEGIPEDAVQLFLA